MRKILLLVLLVITGHISRAQNKAVEAKAAYQLAEDAYSKSDYKGALDYLQQVKASLGASNCKILYLEIMVTRELYAKEPNVADRVLPLIKEFEKSPDYAEFNEEKTLEITKLKLLFQNQQKAQKKIADSAKAADAVFEKAFNEEFVRFGQLGITLAQLDSVNPGLGVLNWRYINNPNGNTTYFQPWVNFDIKEPAESYPFCAVTNDTVFKNKLSSVNVSGGKIREYRSVLAYADKKINKGKDIDVTIRVSEIAMKYLTKMGRDGFTFTEYNLADKNSGHVYVYSWIRDNKKIVLYWLTYLNGKMPTVKLIEIISYK